MPFMGTQLAKLMLEVLLGNSRENGQGNTASSLALALLALLKSLGVSPPNGSLCPQIYFAFFR